MSRVGAVEIGSHMIGANVKFYLGKNWTSCLSWCRNGCLKDVPDNMLVYGNPMTIREKKMNKNNVIS